MTPNSGTDKGIMASELTSGLEVQLFHVARSATDRAAANGVWRVEREDMLQVARIGAWQAARLGLERGYTGDRLRRYIIGGGRRACRNELSKLRRKDALLRACVWAPLE